MYQYDTVPLNLAFLDHLPTLILFYAFDLSSTKLKLLCVVLG